MRRFLGIVIGLIVGYLIINGIQMIGHNLYPPPLGLENLEYEELSKVVASYIESAPIGALLFVMFSHILGAFIGVIISMLISKAYIISGSIVGGVFMILTVIVVLMIPHPIWFTIIDLIAVLVACLLGLKLSKSKSNLLILN